MSSSEDSAVSCTDSEYEMEAESDLDRFKKEISS